MEKERFIAEFAGWLQQGTAALFVGAGLSRIAGYPDWRTLLKDIADELQIDLDQEHDLAGVAQWYINKSGRVKTRIGQVIRNSFPDKVEVPEAHRILARLSVQHVWTTNYDKLLERAWALQRRGLHVTALQSDLSVSVPWSDTTLYKMHGTVDHPTDIVISTDDYERYRKMRASFLQLLNGHLIGLHFLFLGFSFTDPNIGHLLGLIRESQEDTPTQHYAIVRKPAKGEGPNSDRLSQYDKSRHAHWVNDLQRYGINCVEVDHFDDVPVLLRELEARVARHSVFVSGSYPESRRDLHRFDVEEIATLVGRTISENGLRLVSGFGLTVGSAVTSGVLSNLYATESPSLDRRMFLRPFPQVIPNGFDKAKFQRRYREDMIRQAGVCVYIAGIKEDNGTLVTAPGVLEEFEIARELGKTLIPVACTGGAAAEIWARLNSEGGAPSARLPEEIFRRLGENQLSKEDASKTIVDALEAAIKA